MQKSAVIIGGIAALAIGIVVVVAFSQPNLFTGFNNQAMVTDPGNVETEKRFNPGAGDPDPSLSEKRFNPGAGDPDPNPEPIPDEALFAPAITVSPNPYPEGRQATITGSGFSANEDIAIRLNDNPVQTENAVTTDAVGNFSTQIAIPNTLGDYNVTATDESGKVATVVLTIE